MHEYSRKLTAAQRAGSVLRRVLMGLLMLLWIGAGAQAATRAATAPAHLGWDIPTERIDDADSGFTPSQVAGMNGGVITANLHRPLNAGYLHHTVWLRFRAPGTAGDPPLWLLAEPTYVDSITVYQPGREGEPAWRSQEGGDLVPGERKMGVRQPLFELQPGQITLVKIRTTSAMQLHAQVLTADALRETLATTERNMGLFFGVVIALLIAIVGAAAVFRTQDLWGLAVLGIVSSIHMFNVRGYGSLWAPPQWTVAASNAVGIGAFALAAALAWQIKHQLTSAQRHRGVRRVLDALMVVSVLGMMSPIAGLYGSVAWVNLVSLALCDVIAISLCVTALRHSRQQRTQHAVLLCAYALHMIAGGPIALVLMGQGGTRFDVTLVWQTEIFLFMVLVAGAIFVEMVARYRKAETIKDTALAHLEQSEHLLEERIELRTAELFAAQEELALALTSERTLRQEQRQFFQMISHEFRTPLAVIDSAAAEQSAFPSPELEQQTERAAQIRRACRRLTSLVDSCLVNDRMDKTGFTLHGAPVAVADLLEHAAQLVQWSPKHRLHLFTQASPDQWVCDAALVRIALSNVVDNAVKYAKAGEIFITAVKNDAGLLELSVADDGSGISLEVMNKMFDQFERGNRTDQARGFGLGLWVARRIARLHGGDIQVESEPGRGTCFTLTIANQKIAG
ncbi:MAG: histidine kinase [Comamonadaceae bacterium]|nr:MAG: histidine kinase [Comamonadaceae bacterium]